ncbi:hypothetical protein V8V91_12225 [Algoriphagus halophilus]
MKKSYSLLLIGLMAWACQPKEAAVDYTSMSDEERLKAATEIAHKTIMVDGHVDLPYRMKVGGFTLQREILDVSVRTEGGILTTPEPKREG